ncbi:hypothetical protein NDU88_006998 [Pleurodeles waltl]|uniref:Uncharacterized protein n=1 Tax=Pleurodeles waltl TaxID=8319 RepID=A0AAV7SRJ3_PLEWA|nr:hypothetical protein NDU88_006998 [Pleurodeles waltl]
MTACDSLHVDEATEVHISVIANNSFPKDISLEEIAKAIVEEVVLVWVKESLEKGLWTDFLKGVDRWADAE